MQAMALDISVPCLKSCKKQTVSNFPFPQKIFLLIYHNNSHRTAEKGNDFFHAMGAFCVTIYEKFPGIYFQPTVIRNKDKPLKLHQVVAGQEDSCAQFPPLSIMSYIN